MSDPLFPMEGLEPLTVKVLGLNIIPALSKTMSLLPEKTRKSFNTKQNAPGEDSIPYDKLDCLGSTPYETVELLQGKLWRITFSCEHREFTSAKNKKAAKGFGMDWNNEEVRKKVRAGAASDGPKALETVEADLVSVTSMFNKEEWTMEERFTIPPPMQLNSMVVKLNSGAILLFAPVRIRDEVGFGAWLEGLGTEVAWIVLPSSFHTLSLPNVLARFPQAKVVGAAQAEDKLNHVGALVRGRFDFKSDSPEELKMANQELEPEGVSLFPVEGEVMCNSIMAVAHRVMLTCDLVYNRHDGGIFGIDQEEFNEFKKEHATIRLYKYLMCNKPNSPNGVLAKYRFWAMDHTSSGTGRMLYDCPATDGSTPALMANSLRKGLSLPFDFAVGVHFDHMSREDFRKTINANWGWLDRKSLI